MNLHASAGGRPLRRVDLVLASLALLLACGLGLFVHHAFHAAESEEALRHEMVAARLFDEMERALGEIVEQEEARSFLEYRFFYVPARQVPGQPALARSPLSEPPADPSIVGYYQIEPDGRVTTPLRPRPEEERVASDKYGWVESTSSERCALVAEVQARTTWPAPVEESDTPQPERALAPIVATKVEVLASNEAPPAPGPITGSPVEREPAQERGGVLNSFNRARSLRSQQERQYVPTQAMNIENFQAESWSAEPAEPTPTVQVAVPEEARVPAVPARPTVRRAVTRQPLQAGGNVDVEVSSIQGSRVDSGHLVLQRSVRIGGETWKQGLVLDPAALARRLEGQVLTSSLAGWVALQWGQVSDPAIPDPLRIDRRYAFRHVFAPPFGTMSVIAGMDTLPGERTGGREPVVALAILLAVIGLVGAVSLRRMLAVRLEYAARRGDFVAAVSHELKTPLTSIRMMAEMLRDGMVPEEDRRRQYFESITAEAERLTRLIANVLELARLEKGNRPMRLEAGPVEEVLFEVRETLGPQLRRHCCTLDIQVDPGLPAVAYDRDALLQVLFNLVENAVKFTVDSSNRQIEVRARADGMRVILIVRDHGPGVPHRQIRRIFEPFYRGERELTRRTRGTGIGLALVRGLVHGMGGQVTAGNHPDGGLEVAVMLGRT